jgi:hypothetical protein
MVRKVWTLWAVTCLLAATTVMAGEKKRPSSKRVQFRGMAVIADVLGQAMKERVYSDSTTVSTVADDPQESSTLIVCKQRVVFELEPAKENWRGEVKVTLRIPFRIYYQINLNDIRPEDVNWDAENKRLSVRMPKVTVGVVETLLHDQGVGKSVKYSGARFKVLDSEIEELLTESARKDGIVYARRWGEKQLTKIQKGIAEKAVRKHIELIMKAVIRDAELELR